MLKDQLKNYQLILGSSSPRRQNFMTLMGFDFEIRLKPVEEIYPKHLAAEGITNFLAKLKAEPFLNDLKPNDILITSDTIVWFKDNAIGKPKHKEDAFKMLQELSGNSHLVISSVCFTTTKTQTLKHCITEVKMQELDDKEIEYYLETFKPYDKAGSYGIQEWIGAIGITEINGSYNNVVGMPTHIVYEVLKDLTL